MVQLLNKCSIKQEVMEQMIKEYQSLQQDFKDAKTRWIRQSQG